MRRRHGRRRDLCLALLATLGGLCLLTAGTAARAQSASNNADAVFVGGATTAVTTGSHRDGDLALVAVGVQVLTYRLNSDGRLEPVGRIGPLPEVPEDLGLVGDRLFVSGPGAEAGQDGGPGAAWVRIYDLANPHSPQVVGEALLPARRAGALAVDHGRVMVMTEVGVAFIDIQDPHQPRLLGHILTPAPRGPQRSWWPGGLALAGDRLLVARPEGLFVIDLVPNRVPEVPVPFWSGPAYDVALAGGRALVLGDDGLHVLDLSSPEGPVDASLLDIGPRPRALAAAGGLAVALVDEGTALAWIDLDAPYGPLLTNTIRLPYPPSEHLALALGNGRALLALGRGGLRLVDPVGRTDPGLARAAGDLTVPPLEQLDLEGELLAGAAGPAGLFILGAAERSEPRALAAFQPELPGPNGRPRRVAFHSVHWIGRRLAAHSAEDGLWILDASDPTHPVPLCPPLSVPGLPFGHAMGHDRDFLYVPSADGALHVVDTAAPGGARVVTRLPNLSMNAVLVHGGHLYGTAIGRFNLGYLHVLDLANPAIPRYVRTLDFNGFFSRLSVAGSHLYLTGGYGEMAILDLTDPTAPREVERLKDVYAGQIVDVGGKLIAAQPGRMEILEPRLADVIPWVHRRPGLALPWGRQDWQGTSDVLRSEGKLWVLRHQAGLLRLDAAAVVSDPSTLHLPWISYTRSGTAVTASAPSATATATAAEPDCRSDGPLTLIVDATGALGGEASAAVWAAEGRIVARRSSAAPAIVRVQVDRQARRGGRSGQPAAASAMPAVPLRLDLGLAAADRALAKAAAAGGRMLLVIAAEPDEASWRLAVARAGRLRAVGSQVHALIWQPRKAHDLRPGLLAGSADRVHPVHSAAELGGVLERLAMGCGD